MEADCDGAMYHVSSTSTLLRSVLDNNTRVVPIMCEISAIVVGYCLIVLA